ncbi:CocE/NonD family hydrolase [Streptomyces sp. NPDC087297]|uniref:CocE/NonD family hydrolase n=1 Tax=Streptomyces sp. NPDC087297 TaxID=3365778 RepID=UPI003803A34A
MQDESDHATTTTTTTATASASELPLNGPQTSGRAYADLSPEAHSVTTERNVRIRTRDGIELLADVFRPTEPGTYPVLVAVSPYPRQIQDSGIPLPIVEAGRSDFFVRRGYVHVVVNERGTGGSDGTWTLFDEQQRRDLYDVVEWAGVQDWSTGDVGMIGISYFAMAQMAAATTAPPHLKAIFPVGLSSDLYDLVRPGGLLNMTFVGGWSVATAVAATRSEKVLRGPLVQAARKVLGHPTLHAKTATMNGEAALGLFQGVMRASYPAEPWDEIWMNLAISHPFRDEWWQERTVMTRLDAIRVPVHLGCDWENSPVHLPSTFDTWAGFQQVPEDRRPPVRMTLLGPGGLNWPWESLHTEALAWFDHWLKGRDTGIMDGPPIRYEVPGTDTWRTAHTWPPEDSQLTPFMLGADGLLLEGGPTDGSRSYLANGEALARPGKAAHQPDLPSSLSWTTPPLAGGLTFAGNIEIELDAAITETDTSWIAALEEIDFQGGAHFITPGWLRAALRAVDEEAAAPGRPVHPCTTPEAVPPGRTVRYRIALCPNARHIPAGHRLRLTIGGSDGGDGSGSSTSEVPSPLRMHHVGVGATSVNTVHATSRLLLPVLAPGD